MQFNLRPLRLEGVVPTLSVFRIYFIWIAGTFHSVPEGRGFDSR
jgi:hypothetical protein